LLKNLNFSITKSTQAKVDARIRASQAKAEAKASIAASSGSASEGGQNNPQDGAGGWITHWHSLAKPLIQTILQ